MHNVRSQSIIDAEKRLLGRAETNAKNKLTRCSLLPQAGLPQIGYANAWIHTERNCALINTEVSKLQEAEMFSPVTLLHQRVVSERLNSYKVAEGVEVPAWELVDGWYFTFRGLTVKVNGTLILIENLEYWLSKEAQRTSLDAALTLSHQILECLRALRGYRPLAA